MRGERSSLSLHRQTAVTADNRVEHEGTFLAREREEKEEIRGRKKQRDRDEGRDSCEWFGDPFREASEREKRRRRKERERDA